MDIVKYNKHILTQNINILKWSDDLLKSLPAEVLFDAEIEEVLFDNTYSRTMYAPTGSLIIGKTHKQSAYNIVLEGKVIVYMLGKAMYFEEGDTFISPPLSKKVIKILEDTKFMNVFSVDKPTELKDMLDTVTYTNTEEEKLYRRLAWQEYQQV